MNDRCQQKNHVGGIGETLLVLRISGASGIERTPVIANLNLARDFGTIWIAVMQQQFSRAKPARVEIGQIATRATVGGCLRQLMRD